VTPAATANRSAAEIAARVVAQGVAPLCAAGCAGRSPESTPEQGPHWRRETGGATDALFDLASVTKPMTAVAIALAGMDRTAPIATWLPEVRGTPSERIPLELFLAHRAGLDGHRALYEPILRGQSVDLPVALRTAASARRDDAHGEPPPEGFSPVYSDLGYVLAGVALARAVRAIDAGEAIGRLVLDPLGLAGQAGTVRDLAVRGCGRPFVPTEDVAFRGGRIVGAVHDENAWALTELGGSGHAGIFGTVDAVLTFGEAVHDATAVQDAAARDAAFHPGPQRTDATSPLGRVDLRWLLRERPGGTLRAGFDGKSAKDSSAGPSMSPRSFGHLGFVGTSLWVDPDAHRVVVLLSNRVFHGRHPAAIRSARPEAHDALWRRAAHFWPDLP
jgi:CubicO group peptidase (beta-lactamase class C family)